MRIYEVGGGGYGAGREDSVIQQERTMSLIQRNHGLGHQMDVTAQTFPQNGKEKKEG